MRPMLAYKVRHKTSYSAVAVDVFVTCAVTAQTSKRKAQRYNLESSEPWLRLGVVVLCAQCR